jgi:lipopolysaccharide export system protein LptA
LKATLGTDARGRGALRTAEATGQVEFVYDRPQPLSKLNGTARRARYDDQKRTITLEGDVSLDGEDEFYRVSAGATTSASWSTSRKTCSAWKPSPKSATASPSAR